MSEAAEIPLKELIPKMRRAGIGARYFDRRLQECGEVGVRMLEEIRDRTRYHEIRRLGHGYSVHGGTKAHDFFMLFARALHLHEVRIRVISLSTLAVEVSGPSIASELLEVEALFVTPFYRPSIKQPLTDFQRLAVEDFFHERLDNAGGVFTLASTPLRDCQPWWSPELLDRLVEFNVEVSV